MVKSPEPVRCQGFTPPFILERLREHGNERQRRRAHATLTRDQTLRATRQPLSADERQSPTTSQPGQPARYIHSAEHGETLPGVLVREEGQPSVDDSAVEEAYRWLGATYRFFWEVFERHSIDGLGMPLVGTVHFGQEYDNAFWNGTQMVFGDGDGELFRRFTIALDVVAHELAHGVTEREAGLVYSGQSGALNESLSDVFGSLVKQYHLGQTAERADWLIGTGLFTDTVQGRALRSMAAPGTAFDDPVLGHDPQPAHMDDFVVIESDNGGVHINSGIPNHAFYLAALALEGYAWETLGRVWYQTLHDPRLTSEIDFAGFAALTIDNADRHYGRQNRVQRAVHDAWQQVGVIS